MCWNHKCEVWLCWYVQICLAAFSLSSVCERLYGFPFFFFDCVDLWQNNTSITQVQKNQLILYWWKGDKCSSEVSLKYYYIGYTSADFWHYFWYWKLYQMKHICKHMYTYFLFLKCILCFISFGYYFSKMHSRSVNFSFLLFFFFFLTIWITFNHWWKLVSWCKG